MKKTTALTKSMKGRGSLGKILMTPSKQTPLLPKISTSTTNAAKYQYQSKSNLNSSKNLIQTPAPVYNKAAYGMLDFSKVKMTKKSYNLIGSRIRADTELNGENSLSRAKEKAQRY